MNSHERIRVLLADDHRILREALHMVLASECDIVGEAASGEAAVAMATQLRPHVVVLDVGMPGMGGLAAAHRISRDAPACKVLILSQYDDEEYVIEARGRHHQGSRSAPRYQPQDRAGASREPQAKARPALDRRDGPLRDQAQVHPPRLIRNF